MEILLAKLMFFVMTALGVFGWIFMLDYRKQNKFLRLKIDGYKNIVLAYMMYRYRDLARIEKLENELKVCEFGRGKTNV